MNGAQVIDSIKHGFTGVLRRRGRDRRSHFWPYALVVSALAFAGTTAVAVPMVFGSLARAEQLAQQHPEDFEITRSPGQVSWQYTGDDPTVLAQLMPDFGAVLVGVSLVCAVAAALLATAMARRLHDRGRSGKWLMVPAVFLVFGLWLQSRVMSDFMAAEPDFVLFGLLFANNILYLSTLLVLFVHLVLPGNPGPNAYGAPPDQ